MPSWQPLFSANRFSPAFIKSPVSSTVCRLPRTVIHSRRWSRLSTVRSSRRWACLASSKPNSISSSTFRLNIFSFPLVGQHAVNYQVHQQIVMDETGLAQDAFLGKAEPFWDSPALVVAGRAANFD